MRATFIMREGQETPVVNVKSADRLSALSIFKMIPFK